MSEHILTWFLGGLGGGVVTALIVTAKLASKFGEVHTLVENHEKTIVKIEGLNALAVELKSINTHLSLLEDYFRRQNSDISQLRERVARIEGER